MTLTTKELLKMSIARFLPAMPLLGLLFFLPAGTLRYWQAWMYLATIFIPMFFVLIYLLKNDPALLERRMKAREKETQQKWVVFLSLPFLLLSFLLPGFDIRYGWSTMPAILTILADLVVLGGYLLFFAVLKENSYASRIVEVEHDQKVITSGPYAVVRHPMYTGILLLYLFSPLALGSYWGVIPAAVLVVVIIIRIRNEEEVLLRELKGYAAYTRATRYRLIPGIW